VPGRPGVGVGGAGDLVVPDDMVAVERYVLASGDRANEGRPGVVLLGREGRVRHAVELELDPDRMSVVPGVAGVPRGITFVDDLSDVPIAANDVMRAHVRRHVVEGPQRARVADVGVMDDDVVDRCAIAAGPIIRRTRYVFGLRDVRKPELRGRPGGRGGTGHG